MDIISPILVVGCSGPRALSVILENIAIGYYLAFFAAGLLLCSLILSLKRQELAKIPIAIFVLLAIHPAWTISARQGDCGFMNLQTSIMVARICLGLLVWQIVGYILCEGFGTAVDHDDPPDADKSK